ncbi:uncharacterized protein LOC129773155 [Toxorhynchites rutilus septentrionalis]|uniref:uncharacterized protein LOC129773155 n=1 Tax=Toxorhynchites rutilus septentrionalis TaxID=329112 RepID=UPI0024786BB9|nr:uncharacterized protein LOC129773155 [Toxorhynchites rutilus septentrionalis]
MKPQNMSSRKVILLFPEAADIIKNRHYVDDAMFSTDTPEHAIRLAREVSQVHSAGGFEIRNWVSNSQQVLSALKEGSMTEKNMDLTTGPMATEKVLGMCWCTKSDEFIYKIGWNRFNPDLLNGCRRITKRQMLQILMTIFDPLGLISHFLMYLKVLLQEVWRAGIQWDEQISDPLHEKNFLSWINSDHRRYSTFVAFRVSEILDATEAADWHWVPSKQNVADDGTKWETQPDLSSKSRWFRGPDFLYRSEAEWPKSSSKSMRTDNELRSSLMIHHLSPDSVINVADFSSWKRLNNVVAYVHRFIENCRRRRTKQSIESGPLSREELYASEGFLFRLAQREGYNEEVVLLTANCKNTSDNVLPKSSRLYKLLPRLDERGVMRMRSRIAACQYATEDAKSPVILPNDEESGTDRERH